VAFGLFGSLDGSGGPGRGRSHNAAGIVNTNHQTPTRNRTTRREKVVLFMNQIMTIDMHCTNRPALYPMPIPVDDICVESCNSMDVTFSAGGSGRASSGDDESRAVVSFVSACCALRDSPGGSSSRTVD